MTEQDVAIRLNDHDHEIGSLKHRVKSCEENQKVQYDLIRTVDKLANAMENMLTEQKSQGKRLERLECEPANDFKYYKRLIVGYVITGIIGVILGAIFALIFK